MAFKDLAGFQLVKPLALPIRGKEYVFPGDISARGLDQLQRLNHQIELLRADVAVPEDEALTDAEMDSVEAEMFGDLKQKLIDDGCLSSEVKAVFWTLLNYHLVGIEAAEDYWNSLGEAVAPGRKRSRGSRASSKPPQSKRPAPRGTKSSPTES